MSHHDTDEPTPEPTAFQDFALDPAILRALDDLGFESPTPVQAASIPPLLEGRDVIGRARTGSGKTAAYALPMLQCVADAPKEAGPVLALVLAPTRELAQQVASAIDDLGRHLRIRATAVYGGASFVPQLKALERGATIVVGTPGRTLDHLNRGSLDLSGTRFLVLDEADEMLRMGFLDDVEAILAACPRSRQTALLSATMPDDIRRVATGHLHDPVELSLDDDGPRVDHIDQSWMRVPQRHKLEALHRVLLTGPPGATVVFARTRIGCAEVADALAQMGIPADALHGDLNQAGRDRVVERLRAGATRVVVATDVAARGLDVDHVSRVINLDLPPDVETYVHRIGRTARAGRDGEAITFVTSAQRRRIGGFEKALGITIRKLDVPDDLAIAVHRQDLLQEELVEASSGPAIAEAHGFASRLVDDGWSLHDLAAAALARLAALRDVDLRDPDALTVDEPPPQSQPPHHQAVPDELHVRVFFSIGDRQGVRPGDLVGALANEAGLPVPALGRIDIQHRKAFVSMPPEMADDLVRRFSALEIRGHRVRVALDNRRR